METITVTTYSGNNTILRNRKAIIKAAKACAILGSKPPFIENPTNEGIVKYLRAKQASFSHSLDRADIYSMKIINRNIFVI
jgi:hypothetical protein